MRARTSTPRRPLRTARALVLALAPACGLSACGSGMHPGTPPPTVTHTVTRAPTASTATGAAPSSPATATATTTHTSPPTMPTPTQSAEPAGDECVAADLALSFLGAGAAAGHGELGFALRNTSRASCRTGGYPGVRFLGAAGAGLPTTPDHTTEDFFGEAPLRELTVAPGAAVSFRLGVSHTAPGGGAGGCVNATGLQVIAPNDTATMRVPLAGGAAECGGAVTVTPIQPGTTAFH